MASLEGIRQWFGEWLGLVVGILLIVVGVAGHIRLHDYPLLRSLSEALLVAGILTLTVDPFIKRRLLREASKDIFHHLLGFDLPDEIKERLKSIVLGTDLYRKDMEITCSFTEVEDGIRLDIEYRFEVINPTNHNINFRQWLKFEKAERPQLRSVSCSIRGDEYGRGAQLSEQVAEEGEVLAWRGRSISIPPKKHNQRIWFRYRNPRFSPDGKHLAASVVTSNSEDIWVFDLQRQSKSRLTFALGRSFHPTWSPDGRWIYYSAFRDGRISMYRRPSDGTRNEEAVLDAKGVRRHTKFHQQRWKISRLRANSRFREVAQKL